jgi:hypothetical protein
MSAKSDEVYIVRTPVRENFTVLPNALLRDKRLSWASVGLLCFLLHLPSNFKLKLYNLAKVKPGLNGRDATRSALKALEIAGYVRIARTRTERGTYARTTWYVSSTPSIPAPETDFPYVDEPDAVEPT